jgi:hypothetical protein
VRVSPSATFKRESMSRCFVHRQFVLHSLFNTMRPLFCGHIYNRFNM